MCRTENAEMCVRLTPEGPTYASQTCKRSHFMSEMTRHHLTSNSSKPRTLLVGSRDTKVKSGTDDHFTGMWARVTKAAYRDVGEGLFRFT